MRVRAPRALLVVTALLCGGCGGFGLGGGDELGVLPSSIEMERPDTKAALTGTVVVDEGFLPVLVERLKVSEGRGGLPEGLSLVLTGPKGIWHSEVDEAGRFAVEAVYAGSYDLVVRCTGVLLARMPVLLRERASLDVTVRILGYDLADLDGDGDEGELVSEYRLRFAEEDTEFLRDVWADGSMRTLLPDGTVEYWNHGVARVMRPDGDVEIRLDRDNDFLPDAIDRDDDGDGLPDHRDPDSARATAPRPEDAVRGVAAEPLVEEVTLTLLGDARRPAAEAAPGDLLLVAARTSTGGGPALAGVECRIHRFGRPVYALQLRDDASEEDLVAQWPGMQVSGDLARGDGVWSAILPIDRTTLELVHECLLVVQGRNRDGRSTNRRVMPLSCSPPAAVAEVASGPGLDGAVGEFRLYERQGPGGAPSLVGRVDVAADVGDGVTLGLVLPGGGTKLLTPAPAEGGRVVFSSSALERVPGLYVLKAGNRVGQVFYAGFPVRGE